MLSLLFAAGCSSSNAPSGATSNDFLPLSSGTWWRYQTPTGVVKRTVEGTATELGRQFYTIRDSASNTLQYIRRDSTQYYYLYFNSLGEPMVEEMIIDESPSASWSAEIRLDAESISESFGVSQPIQSRTVLGKSYSNVLRVHRLAYRTQGGVKDTIVSDQYLAKGVGEIELVVNGVGAEQLLDYHYQ